MIKKNLTGSKQEIQKDPYAEPAAEYNDLYKQYVNLERDYLDAKKLSEEYSEKYSRKSYEAECIQQKFDDYKQANGRQWAEILASCGIIAGIIAIAMMFFTAMWVDKHTVRELYNYENNKIIVHSVEPFRTSAGKDYAKYYFADERNNTRNVVLIDKKGKYNIGDTVKFTK